VAGGFPRPPTPTLLLARLLPGLLPLSSDEQWKGARGRTHQVNAFHESGAGPGAREFTSRSDEPLECLFWGGGTRNGTNPQECLMASLL